MGARDTTAAELLYDALDASRRQAGASGGGVTTGAQLAAAAHASRSLVADYLRSAKQPSLPQLRRLVEAAGCSLQLRVVPGRTFRPLTLRDAALEVPNLDDHERWVLVRELVRCYAEATPVERVGLLAGEPPRVDPRWDALWGGVAEHLALVTATAVPRWALRAERYLSSSWFPLAHGVGGRTRALASAPAALAVRNVWVERDVLERKELAREETA